MKNFGYVDVSNLVHRTINGYFSNIKEIKDLRNKKKTFKNEQEYNEEKEKIINKFIIDKGEGFEYLLLSMVFNTFENMRKEVSINEEEYFAIFDSSSWRKSIVKDFYKNNEEDTKTQIYKEGRNSLYKELIHKTIENLQKLIKELGYSTFKYENPKNFKNSLEADDIIAILIKENPNASHTVCSNDIDFYQLQKQENVKQYNPISKKFINLTKKEAKEALLHKKIAGDSSDNIPKIINFEILKKDNISAFEFPRIGDKTFTNIIEQYNIEEVENNPEEILKEIAIKIYTYSILKLPIKPKPLSELKKLIEEKNIEEINSFISKIIEETKIQLKEELEKNNKKKEKTNITKEELEKIEKKEKTIEEKIIKINEELITENHSIEEIIEKLKKQFKHNEEIIDFNYIPKELKEDFIKNIKFNTIKTQEEKKVIFEKYKLFNIAKQIKISNQQEKQKEKEDKEETILTITKEEKYFKVSGYIKKEILEKLEKTVEINKFLSKIEIEGKTEWILKIKDEEKENQKYINWNLKLLNFVKEISENLIINKLKENKKQIKTELRNTP